MRLNPDCIRAILLTVEENCDFDTPWQYVAEKHNSEYLSTFTHSEIIYHISQCSQMGFFASIRFFGDGEIVFISDLSPIGHEFLSNIRNEPLWKKILQKGAGASLPILIELAKEIALKHYLG